MIELVAEGLKNREIAEELGIGEHVVRNYLSKIYDKIGVSNRVELACGTRHELTNAGDPSRNSRSGSHHGSNDVVSGRSFNQANALTPLCH